MMSRDFVYALTWPEVARLGRGPCREFAGTVSRPDGTMGTMTDSADAPSRPHTTSIATAFPVHGGVVSIDALTLRTKVSPCDAGSITIAVPPLGGPEIASMLDESGAVIVSVLRAIIAAPAGAVSLGSAAHKDDPALVVALILSALGGPSNDVERPGFPPPTLMRAIQKHLQTTYGTACEYLKGHGFMRDDVDALRARLVDGIRVRAGAFVRKDGRLAIVGRHRDGQSYSVTPGGGVEPGETCAEAAVREPAALRLEFPGSVQLFYEATTTDEDLSLGGPEAARQSSENTYEPRWADPLTVDDLRPEDVATYVRAHAPGGCDGLIIRPIRDLEELDAVCAVVGADEHPSMTVDDWRFDLVREDWNASRPFNLGAWLGDTIVGGALCRNLDDGVRVAILGVDQRWQRLGIGENCSRPSAQSKPSTASVASTWAASPRPEPSMSATTSGWCRFSAQSRSTRRRQGDAGSTGHAGRRRGWARQISHAHPGPLERGVEPSFLRRGGRRGCGPRAHPRHRQHLPSDLARVHA